MKIFILFLLACAYEYVFVSGYVHISVWYAGTSSVWRGLTIFLSETSFDKNTNEFLDLTCLIRQIKNLISLNTIKKHSRPIQKGFPTPGDPPLL